jgi:hypothetical protein
MSEDKVTVLTNRVEVLEKQCDEYRKDILLIKQIQIKMNIIDKRTNEILVHNNNGNKWNLGSDKCSKRSDCWCNECIKY